MPFLCSFRFMIVSKPIICDSSMPGARPHKPAIGLIGLVLVFSITLTCQAQQSFADIHVHYNWDQKEIIDAQGIVEKMKQANIEFAVVASTPSNLALELKRAGGDMIIPIFSPYTHELGKRDWYIEARTLQLAEKGLRNRQYQGIGEVHFMAVFGRDRIMRFSWDYSSWRKSTRCRY